MPAAPGFGAWLFICIAFIGSAYAFYAWGASRTRAVPRPPAPAEPVAPSPARSGTEGALPALLALMPGAALVAHAAGGTWRATAMNDAARALWPGTAGEPAAQPRDLAELPDLPAGWQASFETLSPAEPVSLGPWQAAAVSGASGTRSVLLARDTRSQGSAREIDEFSSTLSHDLRAPIRVVEGFTRILKEDYGRGLDRVANDHLDRVLAAAARMNGMIDALLTMARLSSQPLSRQPVDLSQLASFVLDDLKRAYPERAVAVEIEPGLGATGDPMLLRLVLENLLGNAWKYTGKTPAARIALKGTRHGGAPAFEVVDNGAGFDMRSADRLFGLFHRLHSANDFAGHGVGLASVKRIVQRHGGEIWAKAEPGRGATFTFTLP